MSSDRKILIEKLYGQLQENAEDSHLLLTAQMLVAALQSSGIAKKTSNVTVISPVISEMPFSELRGERKSLEDKEIVAEIKEEVQQEIQPLVKKKKINHNKLIEKELSFFQIYKEEENNKTVQQSLFSDLPDNLIEVNERLKRDKIEIADNQPINDLKSAIGINDRYLYINELFRGDATVYERSILTINNFSSLKESMEWIERSLRLTYFWDENNKTVQQFYNIVKRRFS